jgi:hypothetical protein
MTTRTSMQFLGIKGLKCKKNKNKNELKLVIGK